MAHKLGVDAVCLVKFLLEFKKYEDLLHASLYYIDPVPAPRPYLRAYVVYDRYGAFFKLFGEAQVEPGIIDEYGKIGAFEVRFGQDGFVNFSDGKYIF